MKSWILAIPIIIALAACSPSSVDPTPIFHEPQSSVTVPPHATETAPVRSEPTAAMARVDAIPPSNSAQWTLIAGDFRRPLALAHAGDDRLYVVEQEGVIWILENGERLAKPFLDLRQRVNDRANEQGLLDLAFHPDYALNGHFFINYTVENGATHISRFSLSADPQRADADSEMLLLKIDQPYGNHNGGALAFGPDGHLYIGMGDGGSGGDPLGNGQRLDTLLGKILRVDVGEEPYAIPPDNPFAQGGGRAEIWASGLRNPWRIAFDPVSEDLYIADVGQNQWEEINFQAAGSPGGDNYGWNLREGAHPFAGGAGSFIDPVAEYDHSMGCSVTGGETVRDPRLPGWSGVYLYGDYCSGRIWGLLPAGDGTWSIQLLYETDLKISAFGRDISGRVYLVDHRGGIFRLDPPEPEF